MQRDGTGTTSAPLGRVASIRLLGLRGRKASQLAVLTAVEVFSRGVKGTVRNRELAKVVNRQLAALRELVAFPPTAPEPAVIAATLERLIALASRPFFELDGPAIDALARFASSSEQLQRVGRKLATSK